MVSLTYASDSIKLRAMDRVGRKLSVALKIMQKRIISGIDASML